MQLLHPCRNRHAHAGNPVVFLLCDNAPVASVKEKLMNIANKLDPVYISLYVHLFIGSVGKRTHYIDTSRLYAEVRPGGFRKSLCPTSHTSYVPPCRGVCKWSILQRLVQRAARDGRQYFQPNFGSSSPAMREVRGRRGSAI